MGRAGPRRPLTDHAGAQMINGTLFAAQQRRDASETSTERGAVEATLQRVEETAQRSTS